jgi:glycosyltransferase involved in cell wall biosynthesis
MKVLHISTSDGGGGAARAAYRLHSALCRAGVASVMRTADKTTDDPTVLGPVNSIERLAFQLKLRVSQRLNRLQRSPNRIFHSVDWFPSRLDRFINASDADVVHLHWVHHNFLSIEAIGRIRKPVVWTLHDSWGFCGAEHHPHGLDDTRHREGYERSNRDLMHGCLDLDRWCWQRKKRAWLKPMHVVCPSRWLADCAQRSALMREWPVATVPNVVPIDVYRPLPRSTARDLFRLPQGVPLILFGSIGGVQDPNKGWDLLVSALQAARPLVPEAQAVVLGRADRRTAGQLPLPVHFIGHLHDDQAIAMLYSAADLVVVPSRIENLPQAATEAQSCGVPVVAFRAGGMPEAVEHGVTGFLADPYDPKDLARGVEWVLQDEDRYRGLCLKARAVAAAKWAAGIVVQSYREIYDRICRASNVGSTERP